jgi:excisionase family DNA binding protein
MEKPTHDGMPEELRMMRNEFFQLKAMMQSLLDREEQKENEETWLSVEDAAELTGQKEQTVRTKVSQNEMPSHKIAGRRMFLKSELLTWMKEGGKSHVCSTHL